MPVRQAFRLTERLYDTKAKDRRVLARTQFGKRLLLLPRVEASEIIHSEEDDDDEYTERGSQQGAHSRYKGAGAGRERGCAVDRVQSA
jgi:hypothetical protein